MNNVYQAINAIMEDLEPISKDKRASYGSGNGGYAYRGVDDVMNALQPLMKKHGLFVVPKVVHQEREERIEEKEYTVEEWNEQERKKVKVPKVKVARTKFSILTIEYTFYALDGTSVTATVVGEGMDSGDKASNKAMSVAYKYACFQVFSIPTEEMVDPDAEIHGNNYPVNAAPPAPPQKYCCDECGKEFTPVLYKGEQWTAERLYNQAKLNNPDSVARCADCRKKHEAAQAAEKENNNG